MTRLTITGIDFIDGLKLDGDAQVFIHGADFKLDDLPVDYGLITAPGGHLSGDLLHGHIECSLFFLSDTAAVTLMPEPATVAFLALGALALSRRPRASRNPLTPIIRHKTVAASYNIAFS